MITKEQITLGPGGEIQKADITHIKKVSAEEFCQVYLKDNEEFWRLNGAENNVLKLAWLTSTYYADSDYQYPGNMVHCNKNFRELVKTKTGLSESAIKTAISSLVKKFMLLKDSNCKGIYYLNPNYFFKGSISDRTKVIKHTIEYQIS